MTARPDIQEPQDLVEAIRHGFACAEIFAIKNCDKLNAGPVLTAIKDGQAAIAAMDLARMADHFRDPTKMVEQVQNAFQQADEAGLPLKQCWKAAIAAMQTQQTPAVCMDSSKDTNNMGAAPSGLPDGETTAAVAAPANHSGYVHLDTKVNASADQATELPSEIPVIGQLRDIEVGCETWIGDRWVKVSGMNSRALVDSVFDCLNPPTTPLAADEKRFNEFHILQHLANECRLWGKNHLSRFIRNARRGFRSLQRRSTKI